MKKPRMRVWVAKHHFPQYVGIDVILAIPWEQILEWADRPRGRHDELLLLDRRTYLEDLRREFEPPPSAVPEI